MIVTLTIARYTGSKTIFGLLSMMIFTIFRWFSLSKSSFMKLLGTGKNGTFDIEPDLGQWGYMSVWQNVEDHTAEWTNGFYKKYISKFAESNFTIFLEPMISHGFWDRSQPFGTPTNAFKENDQVAVLTRASIRFSKLKSFWQNVPAVAKNLELTPGLLFSIGVGEIPLIKQATLSIWDNEQTMKAFAYRKKEHNKVIEKTKSQNWYSEEMFTRFKIIKIEGNIPEKLLPLYTLKTS